MNRIDRLLAILLTLQHKRRVRAQDLSQQFEVSKRTIYRDMSALNQMGIPIAALPGEGFELVEGYYIPPLMFTRDELECDYYGTSLHKWLHAPIGAGFLYVRREKIEKLWSLMGSSAAQVKDIRKYEEIGTHPQANYNAISTALSFHHQLGPERVLHRDPVVSSNGREQNSFQVAGNPGVGPHHGKSASRCR